MRVAADDFIAVFSLIRMIERIPKSIDSRVVLWRFHLRSYYYLSHVLLSLMDGRRQLQIKAWLCLAFLSIGLIVVSHSSCS